MPKRFGVNMTRTITVEQTVYVSAKNRSEALEKVQSHYDEGKGGDPHVEFKNAKGFAKYAGDYSITEEITVDDAWEDDSDV